MHMCTGVSYATLYAIVEYGCVLFCAQLVICVYTHGASRVLPHCAGIFAGSRRSMPDLCPMYTQSPPNLRPISRNLRPISTRLPPDLRPISARSPQVMGRSLVHDFIMPEFQKSVEEVLRKALAGVETSNFEFPL